MPELSETALAHDGRGKSLGNVDLRCEDGNRGSWLLSTKGVVMSAKRVDQNGLTSANSFQSAPYSRRSFLAGSAACALSFALPAEAAPGKRPNILLITSDQQRKDSMGVYHTGNNRTPNLDALGRDGVVYDRMYVAHPTCTPSRATILTGQYASRHGAYTIGTTLAENCVKFSDHLNAAGYKTYAVGKMHFQPVSTEGRFEAPPRIFDEQFWREFDGPYYGFQWTRLLNRHSSEPFACRMRYGVWLKDHGLSEADLKRYFHDQTGRWDLPREVHSSVFVADYAIEAILKHKSSDTPFFVWASFPDPHDPHVVPAPYDDMFDPEKVEYLGVRDGEFDNRPPIYRQLYEKGSRGLEFNDQFGVPSCGPASAAKAAQWRKETAIHHGMVSLMDEEIGRIIKTLKENNLYENTLIVFTSDHGDYLGNHGFHGKGFPAFEEVYNVPLVVKNPAQKGAGTRSQSIIGTLDLAPTFLDAAGVAIPREMQGVSECGVFSGSKGCARDSFLIENRAVEKRFYQKMMVTDRYKLVAYMDEEYGELYDLKNDPNQYDNLWGSPGHREVQHSLLAQICLESGDCSKVNPEKASIRELLALMTNQIRAEGPVQPRTSYS